MHLMHNAADDVNGKGIMSPEYSLSHGLRTPRDSFFRKNSELLGLGRPFDLKFVATFGVFLAILVL